MGVSGDGKMTPKQAAFKAMEPGWLRRDLDRASARVKELGIALTSQIAKDSRDE